jgi:hypothetical protein
MACKKFYVLVVGMLLWRRKKERRKTAISIRACTSRSEVRTHNQGWNNWWIQWGRQTWDLKRQGSGDIHFNKGSKFVSLEEGFFRLWTHEFPIGIEVGIPTVGNTFFDEYLFGQFWIDKLLKIWISFNKDDIILSLHVLGRCTFLRGMSLSEFLERRFL